MAQRTPIIAIVGRPNVGKSTLFNRIINREKAVVEDEPGVTRDRNYELVERYSYPFIIVDTGGFVARSQDELAQLVSMQTSLAINEADAIIAMFDGNAGLCPEDREVVALLRRQEKPVYYAVNKCDGKEQHLKISEFYQLGVSELRDISALSGHGVSALVEDILENFPDAEVLAANWSTVLEQTRVAEEMARKCAKAERDREVFEEGLDGEDEGEFGDAEFCARGVADSEDDVLEPNFAPVFLPGEGEEESSWDEYESAHKLRPILSKTKSAVVDEVDFDEEEFEAQEDGEAFAVSEIECINVAIVGRPNVGKSTLLNKIVGEERAIVSSVAGTTRDPLDIKLRREGQDYLIVDTAGIRKQARIFDRVEHFSAMRSLRALADSDVAVLVIDAVEGPQVQDAKIAGMAHDQGKGLVIAVNKWDLVEKDYKSVREYTLKIREVFKFAPYAPIVFISALSGRRCPRVIDSTKMVAYERTKRVSTGSLNRILRRALKRVPLPSYRGRPLKLYYGQQVAVEPPRFVLFFNHPRGVHFSVLRFLKNELREAAGFENCEIKLFTKKRS